MRLPCLFSPFIYIIAGSGIFTTIQFRPVNHILHTYYLISLHQYYNYLALPSFLLFHIFHAFHNAESLVNKGILFVLMCGMRGIAG